VVLLRKAHAGSCSLGYTWPTDGAVVQVRPEHVDDLLAIPGGEFTVVAQRDEQAPVPEATGVVEEPAPPAGAETRIEEPAPAGDLSEAPAPRRRGRPPKAPEK
jgi:hypothetical protein